MADLKRHCLVEHLLGGRSAVYRLVPSTMVVVVSEPARPAASADWTAPPKRAKAVDSHRDHLKPLLYVIALAVVELAAQLTASKGGQIAAGINEKHGVGDIVGLGKTMQERCRRIGSTTAVDIDR